MTTRRTHSSPYPSMGQNPPPNWGSMVSPAACAGITGFLVGIGIGIGIGALIFDRPWRHGGVGGGLWFGRRRRRSIYEQYDEDDLRSDLEELEVMRAIEEAEEKYGS